MDLQLRANFGGLPLASPVIVGACPMTMHDQSRLAMVSAGAGAIILPSLSEEQVILWGMANGRTITDQEQTVMMHASQIRDEWDCPDAESYLSIVRQASSMLTVPLIASLNGFTAGGWTEFAAELQAAGASAIELNVHHARTCDYRSSAEIEETIIEAVRQVKQAITVPLFVKLGRQLTSVPHMACRLLSGIDGLVLYGRTRKVDICLDDLRLATRWKLSCEMDDAAELEMLVQIHSYCPSLPLAASGGIDTADQLIKSLLAGADVALVTSAIYREGPDIIRTLLDGLIVFMETHHMPNLNALYQRRPVQLPHTEEPVAPIETFQLYQEEQPAPAVAQSDRWGHRIH